ncbi:MAG: pyridoxamine 5'-phosphate oxidase family protein [Anaerolineales bacterium]|nr:pyridoxamine 5'-phosphate oxidase family protein [Anaerolineales bacterium]
MPPLKYHSGQRSIQEEAKTTHVAANLASWVGPVGEFAQLADLALLANWQQEDLAFTILSGKPPLVQVDPHAPHRLLLPSPIGERLPALTRCGGLFIHLGQARRVRVNGELTHRPDGVELVGDETFTLCRKYMSPSEALSTGLWVGPQLREPIAIDDPWAAGVVGTADVSFLASLSPDQHPDVAHRGGPPGFLRFEPEHRSLEWTEYLGDGVFKSAGNIRATGVMTLLVPDVITGDAVELVGRGSYTNIRMERRERVDPLIQDREPYPVQGRLACSLDRAYKLHGAMAPRAPSKNGRKFTADAHVDEQAPQ